MLISGERYPVQMQKNQSFNTLFRHYAKYHGLCKEKLVYFFVDKLKNEDTPESVHILPADEIYVETLKLTVPEKGIAHGNCPLGESLRSLLTDSSHSDIKLVIGRQGVELHAHKAILSARCEYFAGMFLSSREGGGMQEALSGIVRFPEQNLATVQRLLEFIYTGSVSDISSLDSHSMLDLFAFADELLFSELQVLCLECTVAMLTIHNVHHIARFAHNISSMKATKLTTAIHRFIIDHIEELTNREAFRELVQDVPQLSLLLVDDVLGHVQRKRRRMCRDDVVDDGVPEDTQH